MVLDDVPILGTLKGLITSYFAPGEIFIYNAYFNVPPMGDVTLQQAFEYAAKACWISGMEFINTKDVVHSQVFNDAAREGNTIVMKWLVDKGTLFSDHNYHSALCVAAENNRIEAVKWLSQYAPKTYSHNSNTPLYLAVESGCIDVMEYLLSEKKDKMIMWIALRISISSNQPVATKWLTDRGADIRPKAYI